MATTSVRRTKRIIRTAFIALVLIAHVHIVHAQNLVPNSSFEQELLCPDFQSQLDRTAFWFDPSEIGTPDYFHECNGGLFSVPNNTLGYQESAHGKAYAAIFIWAYLLTDYREYLEVELMAPLEEGACYRFSMYANLSDNSQKTSDDLGVYFSDTAIYAPDPYAPQVVPQITLADGELLNDIDWTILEGEYIAHGGEQFLLIGNYQWDSTTTLIPTDGLGNFAYCYIDSVSLVPCVPTMISPAHDRSEITIHGYNDHIQVYGLRSERVHFELFTSTGQVAQTGTLIGDRIPTPTSLSGLHILRIRFEDGAVIHRKLIIP